MIGDTARRHRVLVEGAITANFLRKPSESVIGAASASFDRRDATVAGLRRKAIGGNGRARMQEIRHFQRLTI
jgi:hypothetical protein